MLEVLYDTEGDGEVEMMEMVKPNKEGFWRVRS